MTVGILKVEKGTKVKPLKLMRREPQILVPTGKQYKSYSQAPNLLDLESLSYQKERNGKELVYGIYFSKGNRASYN